MPTNKCFWCKIITVAFAGSLSAILLVISLNVDYQWALAREHIKFRKGFPSQANWIMSPFGTLNCYLFNVTNAEAFLNGTDSKIKVQEVGPIVYHIKGKNEVLSQTDESITYQKLRYHEIQFDPVASCSPDILNKTVILPNLILLGAAAKLHDWVFLVRHAFNAITINESPFINQSVYYFLWNFTTPALNLLSNYVPNVVSNCGMLYNALRKKDEIYNVKIGTHNDFENFFRVNTLNNKTYFPEQISKIKFTSEKFSDMYCPIKVSGSFDNSIFPPFLSPTTELNIVAGEACRTHRLKFDSEVSHLGFTGYRYVINDNNEETSNCLDNAMGVKLHKGMFDVSKCLFNDVPSAFSAPHFFGSSYNWSQHFEGLSPNKLNHEPAIIIEPISGIPIEEKYRFQSNIPLPDMTGYSKELQRFSHMVVPSFWYEYDLDDLPPIVLILLRFNVSVAPAAQPICIWTFFFIVIWCFMYICLTLKGITLINFLSKFVPDKQKTNDHNRK